MGEGKLSQAEAKDQGILLLEGSVGILKPQKGSVIKSNVISPVWQYGLIFPAQRQKDRVGGQPDLDLASKQNNPTTTTNRNWRWRWS